MAEKTTKPREDRILWTCNRLKDPTTKTHCNKLNGMIDKKCTRCKSKREVGALAVNRTRDDIGELVEKSDDGLD
ncbi:hypothetical protein ACLX1H_002993 [Fusarium chlamydosporum]